MKKEIVKTVETALKKLGIESIPAIEVEVPPRESMGDLATTIAMSLAGIMKKPPREIAKDLFNSIRDEATFEKIEIAGPGFINFTFSKNFLCSKLKKIIHDKENVLREDVGKGKTV
ncbi:MAG TPA: arginine--tRNA ligase, partial [Thermodesulfovibrionales bacterium]|nr:arginine--tRNA ligase [Thermodesulfovibrionales bacterium]